MSAPTNTQNAPGIPKLPTLPKEITLKILTEMTQKSECESVCGEDSGDYYTVIYTRGQPDRNGVFGQGQIESIPFHHKCIHEAPVADGEIDFLTPENLSWKLALEKNRVLHQLHIYDRYLNPDIVESMRALWSRQNNGHPDLEAFHREAEHLLVLTGNIMNDLPFAVEAYGGVDGPNRNAYVKKLHANDHLLECQRRGHVMIRSSSWTVNDEVFDEVEEHEYLISQVSDRLDANMQAEFHRALFSRRTADRLALLHLDWSLMTGLESLCLDLSGPWTAGPNAGLKSLCVKMGMHLKLKTLIVLGLPARKNFDKMDKDFWVETLENQEYVPSTVAESHFEDSDESDDENGDDELAGFPTYIYWLKECLQPGGQIHFVMQYAPETEL